MVGGEWVLTGRGIDSSPKTFLDNSSGFRKINSRRPRGRLGVEGMTLGRPQMHILVAGRLDPKAWRQAAQFQADQGKSGMPAWPSGCYLPMAALYAIVSEGKGPLPLDRIGDVGRLAALGSWRVTQGVYRFDQDVYGAVRDTPLTRDLPAEILHRLPFTGSFS